MPVAITLPKLSFPVGALKLRHESGGMTIKPLSTGVGPICNPMPDIKYDADKALAALSACWPDHPPTLAV